MKHLSFFATFVLGAKFGVYVVSAIGTMFSALYGLVFLGSQIAKQRIEKAEKKKMEEIEQKLPHNILNFPEQ